MLVEPVKLYLSMPYVNRYLRAYIVNPITFIAVKGTATRATLLSTSHINELKEIAIPIVRKGKTHFVNS